MVLDTEYDTFPKRLLAISYVVNKKQIVNYVKHDPNVFQVNEEGDAFKVHKLSNNFLQENGLSVGQVLENFSNELDNIDTIMGHNIIAADIDVIRREAIGEKMWFGKIREKFKYFPKLFPRYLQSYFSEPNSKFSDISISNGFTP